MIALVFALREEIKPILKESGIRTLIWERPAVLIEARFRGVPVVFCQTGVGMAKAHEAAESLVECFSPSLILSVGYAGAADPDLRPGDLVVPSEIRSETPTDRFPTDVESRSLLETAIREERIPFKSGPLMTRWRLVQPSEKRIAYQNGSIAVDMETAAVAAVAQKKRIPFLSLRAVFDDANRSLPFQDAEGTSPVSLLLKNPREILRIPKYLTWHRICQKHLARVLGRFMDIYHHSS